MTGTTLAALERRLRPLLEMLYPDRHDEVARRMLALAQEYAALLADRRVDAPTNRTVYLITYGDGIRRPGETPLHTLTAFLREQVGDVISAVHLLPMFPWTSDDGFAVVDHRAVNPDLGTWQDVADLATDHALMFDFVANHTSSSSAWFRSWLAGDPAYADHFLQPHPSFDTSRVVRPRTSPLVHDYVRPDGTTAFAWTTFGASAIRLDAVGFLWKESGTTCLHLPQTHAVVKLWRALVDHVSPGTQLLTETNVPHAENISYFGDGADEAHLVYQFALPPLVLHSFVAGSTSRLADWADGVGRVSDTATWFNVLASHDGIGLRASEGILDETERRALVDRTLSHGGRVSMATLPGGPNQVYELNLPFVDALCTPAEVKDPAIVAAKALAAHSILVAFLGIPAIYYHSLLGSPADVKGLAASGINRRINREVLDADRLLAELAGDPRRRAIFEGLTWLLARRSEQPAFDPYGTQQVERLDDRVLALRRAQGAAGEVLCVTNVTDADVALPMVHGTDVLTGTAAAPLRLGPYGFAWVRLHR